MEEEVKKLREAGFSDEDINAYMQEQKSSSSSTAPGPVSPEQSADAPVRVDETVPDYGGTPETSLGETAGTVAAAVAPYALPVALGTAGLATGAGLYKFGSKALDVGRGINNQMAQRNAIEATRETRLAKRPGFGGTPKLAPAPAPTYNVPTSNVPTPAPAPVPAPAPAAPAPQISNARNIVQKLALDKILPAMGNMASKALPAAQVAAGLFYTSPEEIAILKAAEEKKKRAQGIKR